MVLISHAHTHTHTWRREFSFFPIFFRLFFCLLDFSRTTTTTVASMLHMKCGDSRSRAKYHIFHIRRRRFTVCHSDSGHTHTHTHAIYRKAVVGQTRSAFGIRIVITIVAVAAAAAAVRYVL